MELMIDQPHLIDTLRLRLQAARALPQEDIRLVANVTLKAFTDCPFPVDGRAHYVTQST